MSDDTTPSVVARTTTVITVSGLDSVQITSHSVARTARNQFEHVSAMNEMHVKRWLIIYLNAIQKYSSVSLPLISDCLLLEWNYRLLGTPVQPKRSELLKTYLCTHYIYELQI